MTKQESKILLAHGNGGQLMQELLKSKVLPAFGDKQAMTDGAVLLIGDREIVFSTDSFTVHPVFFPGGDIGKLAATGTINDVAAMGAVPRWLSCAAIIEEGFELADLDRILASIQTVCIEQRVEVVTGDTKVVERGAVDGFFINTAGIGIREHSLSNRFGQIKAGDQIIVSSPIGDHGAAIALARNDLGIASELISDCAALGLLVQKILEAELEVVFMRDPTRGGLATVLNEMVADGKAGIQVSEEQIPIRQETKAICEILGYDPLYLANEGCMVFVVSAQDTQALIELLHTNTFSDQAAVIGEVADEHIGRVVLQTSVGGNRVLDMLVHDQLPRIC